MASQTSSQTTISAQALLGNQDVRTRAAKLLSGVRSKIPPRVAKLPYHLRHQAIWVRQITRWLLHAEVPNTSNWYRCPVLPKRLSETRPDPPEECQLRLPFLDADDFFDDNDFSDEQQLLRPQGASYTTIYGNGNSVTTDQGANGWRMPVSVPVNLGENQVVSGTEQSAGQLGGSSTSKPMQPAKASDSTSIDSHSVKQAYPTWWDSSKGGKTSGKGTQKGEKGPASSKEAEGATNLFAFSPNGTHVGNTTLLSQHGIPSQVPYGETDPVVIPTPDDPSMPGPAGDRQWVVDGLFWEETTIQGAFVHGNRAVSGPPYADMAALMDVSDQSVFYVFPHSLAVAQPESVWIRMLNTHMMFNSGVDVTLQFNASQFHAGSLVLVAIPNLDRDPVQTLGRISLTSLFNFPHQILNLATNNKVTLCLPYHGIFPNSYTYSEVLWTVGVVILTPLQCPIGASSNNLLGQLYFAPTRTTVHGLRHSVSPSDWPEATGQHWKCREIVGDHVFGNIIAGQELPLNMSVPQAPPSDYLPGECHDWIEFAQRQSYIDTIIWTTAEDSGAKLSEWSITSQLLSERQTNVGFVTGLFSQWSGDLNLSLLFTGSAQHYGRLVVAFTPLAAKPPQSVADAMHGTYTVWDINGQSTLDFTIPFISQTNWKTNDPYLQTVTNTLGTVTIWIQNSLQAPAAAPLSAAVVVFVSAASNFRVRGIACPAYTLQPQGDADGTSSIETGTVESEQTPVDTFHYTETGRAPESNLANFFSMYRYINLGSGSDPVPLGNTELIVQLSWTNTLNDFLSSLLSLFTYVKGDLRVTVKLTVSSVTDGPPGQVTISYVPPGGNVRAALHEETLAYQMVEAPLDTAHSTSFVCLNIPYSAPSAAVPMHYAGWQQLNGTLWGVNTSCHWGTLILRKTNTAQIIDVQMAVAFTNFRAWMPRSLPQMNWPSGTPGQSWAMETYKTELEEVLTRKRGKPGTKPASKAPVGASALKPQRGAYYEADWEDYIVNCDVAIVRSDHPDYTHWAVRATHRDTQEMTQISLSRDDWRAVVAFEQPEGEVYKPVAPHRFVQAVMMVGSTFANYSWSNNCTHFVERLCDVSLPNSGSKIATGLVLTGVGLVAAQAALGSRLVPQGLSLPSGNVETAARTLNEAAGKVERAATSACDAAGLVSANLTATAQMVSRSIDEFTGAVKGMIPKVTDGVAKFARKFIAVILRTIACLLIVYSNPTPATLAAIGMIIMSDVVDGGFNPIANLVEWVGRKFQVKFLQSEVQEIVGVAFDGAEATASGGLQPQGAVDDWNKGVLALKNADWIFDKILCIIEKILNLIQKKSESDPNVLAAKYQDKIMELHQDAFGSGPDDDLDFSAIRKNLKLTELMYCKIANGKSPHISVLRGIMARYAMLLGREKRGGPQQRPEPLVVYLHGTPGCGKSILATVLARVIAKRLTGDPNSVYAPSSPDSEFYDGYHGQAVHLIDDIGQDPEGRDYKDFVNVVSTAPFVLPMASLDSKGTYYTSRVVIATSNFPGPNPRSARCIGALERRLHMRLQMAGPKMNVAEATAPGGLPTKHFGSDCPLTRLEGFELKFHMDSKYSTQLEHLDDLVDLILETLKVRESAGSLDHLLPQGGGTSVDPIDTPVSSSAGATQERVRPNLQQIQASLQEMDKLRTEAEAFNRKVTPPRPPPPVVAKRLRDPTVPKTVVYDEPNQRVLMTAGDATLEFNLTTATVEPSVHQVIEDIRNREAVLARLKRWTMPFLAIAGVGSLVATVATLVSLVRKIRSMSTQPAEAAQGPYSGSPKTKKGEKKPAPIPRGQKLVYQGYPAALNTIAGNAVPFVATTKSGDELKCTAFYTHARYCTTVKHMIYDENHHLVETVQFGTEKYNLKDLKYHIHQELVVFEVPSREYKDLRRFVRKPAVKTGFLISKYNGVTAIVRTWDHSLRSVDTDELKHDQCWRYEAATYPGLCGAPLITDDPSGTCLIGIHFAGIAGRIGVSADIRDLLEFIDGLEKDWWDPQSRLEPLPPVPGQPHVSRRSRIGPSPAHGAYPIKKEPAPLTKRDPRIQEGFDLDETVFSKHNKGDRVQPWKNLRAAADLYFSKLPEKLPMLSMSEAINGTDNLDGIDMSQSPGYPWVSMGRSRRSLFEDGPDGYRPKPELVEAVEEVRRGGAYYYTTFLKDELRPTSKNAVGATRVVESAPIQAIIYGRMVLGGLFAHFHENAGKYGSAVGVDPDIHWSILAGQHSAYPHTFDLDYKAWDANLPSCLMDLVKEHLVRIIGEEVDCVMQHIIHSQHLWPTGNYEMHGGMPSGAVGTSIINTMCNNIAVISALMDQPEWTPDFDFLIHGYGDDIIYSTWPVITPDRIKRFYDENNTGLIVTPASKTGEFALDTTIWDVTFLKRRFIPDPIHSQLVHPVIDPDTYQQGAMWIRGGSFDELMTSLAGLAFHAGPISYDTWVSRIREKARERGFEVRVPPFSVLQLSWINKLTR